MTETATPSPVLYLVHGWSYDAGFWDRLLAHLPSASDRPYKIIRHDAGYYGPPCTPALPDQPFWAIGHSAGVMQLLSCLSTAHTVSGKAAPCQGIVAFNGFSCFSARPDFPCGIEGRILQRMHHQLGRNPGQVIGDFRKLCGDHHDITSAAPHQERLQKGLTELEKGDARPTLSAPIFPLYSITGRHDPFATISATLDFTARKSWQVEGGHLLPLTHAAECAALLDGIITSA